MILLLLYHFLCHLWEKKGVCFFLFSEFLPLCVLGEEYGRRLSLTIVTLCLNKGQAFVSSGSCSSSLLTAEILRCSLPELKRENTQEGLLKWGHGHDYKIESFLAGFIFAKRYFLSCRNERGIKWGDRTKEQHLHVWLEITHWALGSLGYVLSVVHCTDWTTNIATHGSNTGPMGICSYLK